MFTTGTFLDEYGLLEWSLLHYARALSICGPRDHYRGLLLRLLTFTPTVLSHNPMEPDSAVQISERLDVSHDYLLQHLFRHSFNICIGANPFLQVMSQQIKDLVKHEVPSPCSRVLEIEESPEFQWTITPPYMFVGYVGAPVSPEPSLPNTYDLEGWLVLLENNMS